LPDLNEEDIGGSGFAITDLTMPIESALAWDGNGTWESFLTFAWTGTDGGQALVTVNYAPHASQGFVQLPFPDLAGQSVRFRDLMSIVVYDCEGSELLSKGVYLNVPEWGYHIFKIEIVI
jgi:hypothetical protein